MFATLPRIEVVKEIRFAVVMYGGVSLAIYINGVAQELLRITRATAVKNGDNGATAFRFAEEELDANEKLYRDLSYLLADKSLVEKKGEQYRAWLRNRRAGANPIAAEKERENAAVVRFVVDILSGSSAGGINGIYMAKALTCGQNLETLEKLWRREGDFSKLLRDDESIKDDGREIGLAKPENQESLLNSERMYLKLLRAFDQMNERCSVSDSFVDAVDLFVTMTDYRGIPVPLRLYDQIIHERRHRQMLHFRFRDGVVNDFAGKFYPFLAYSARCTSSFPLAFDPMRLDDANRIINRVKKTPNVAALDHEAMQPADYNRFFSQVSSEAPGASVDWSKRVFVDGGYLDNKPFGYAIEALAQKQSPALVERKLIYVEPEPDADDYAERLTRTDKPLALENTMAALTDLPRYETIREDLQQVLQRNRLIVRVNALISNARRDEARSATLSTNRVAAIAREYQSLIGDLRADKRDRQNKPVWYKLTVGELAQQRGNSVYPYYRLRVSALNDDLARMATRRAGFDENSDYFLAVRDLVRAWRMRVYGAEDVEDQNVAGDEQAQKTPLEFLAEYDFNYRLRWLRFVLQQADRLLTAEPELLEELALTNKLAAQLRPLNALEVAAMQQRFQLVEGKTFEQPVNPPSRTILDAINTRKNELDRIVRRFKRDLNEVLQNLQLRLWEVDPQSSMPETADDDNLRRQLKDQISAIKAEITKDNGFARLLGKTETENPGNQADSDYNLNARLARAKAIIKERDLDEKFDRLGDTLRRIYYTQPAQPDEKPESIFAIAEAEAARILRDEGASDLGAAIGDYLRHFWDNFDAYDQILFPVTYETPVGESAIVDVARISPLDAASLIDEIAEQRRQKECGTKPDGAFVYKARRKVAGGVFRAFGAFFAETWRQNDIMWGRLDAAERLVSIVFPDGSDLRQNLRREFVEELHETILANDELMRAEYPQVAQPSNGKRNYVEFVRGNGYTGVARDLEESAVMKTAARSLNVLQQVLKQKELGAAFKAKTAALDGIGLLVNENTVRKDVTRFLKAYLQPNWTYAILFLIFPMTLLVELIALSLISNENGYLYAAIVVAVVAVGAPFFVINAIAKAKWNEAKRALTRIIYKNVTGT